MENKVITSVNGLIVINTLRKQIADKVNESMRQLCALKADTIEQAEEMADGIIGRLSVATALDVITNDEYQQACNAICSLINGEAINPLVFDKVEQHYMKDYDFSDAQIMLKINVQECLNKNFARYRDVVIPSAYTTNECLKINRLIVSVSREFSVITQAEYDKAIKLIDDYESGKEKSAEYIIIPKQWYTAP